MRSVGKSNLEGVELALEIMSFQIGYQASKEIISFEDEGQEWQK